MPPSCMVHPLGPIRSCTNLLLCDWLSGCYADLSEGGTIFPDVENLNPTYSFPLPDEAHKQEHGRRPNLYEVP